MLSDSCPTKSLADLFRRVLASARKVQAQILWKENLQKPGA